MRRDVIAVPLGHDPAFRGSPCSVVGDPCAHALNKKGAVRQGLAEVTKIGGLFFGLVTALPPGINGGDCLRQFSQIRYRYSVLTHVPHCEKLLPWLAV